MRWTFHTAKIGKTNFVHAVQVVDDNCMDSDAIAICGYKAKKRSTWRPTIEELTCPKCQKKLHYVLDDVNYWEIGRVSKKD